MRHLGPRVGDAFEWAKANHNWSDEDANPLFGETIAGFCVSFPGMFVKLPIKQFSL